MRRYLPLIIGALIFIISIFLVVQLFSAIFGGDDETEVPIEEAVQLTNFYDQNSTVEYYIDGPIIAEEEHRALEIKVSASRRTIILYEGYDGKVLKQETYGNTQEAYNAFLSAINLLGFLEEQEDPIVTDPAGICPKRERITFTLRSQGHDIKQLWTATCADDLGTFGGDTSGIQDLFEEQIPDYRDITKGEDI